MVEYNLLGRWENGWEGSDDDDIEVEGLGNDWAMGGEGRTSCCFL
jgi:hypothetical protein